MRKRFIFTLCSIVIVGLTPIILGGNLPAGDHIDQEQTHCDRFWSTNYPGEFAQSFKPTVKTITRVQLYGFRNNTPGNLRISIRDSLNGDDLTYSILHPDMVDTFPEWFEVDLLDINITPGDTYYIVWAPLSHTDNISNCYWWGDNFGSPGHDAYPDGIEYRLGDAKQYSDFCFKTYGYSIPDVTILNPTDQSNVSGIVEIIGNAYDSDGSIERVEVKIDDNSWIPAIGTNSWSYNWDTTSVSNGIHTIYARSFDGEYYSNIASIDVYVENIGVLEIGDIQGGLSIVSARINNTGDIAVTNLSWMITIDGGIMNLIHLYSTDTIPVLPAGLSITIVTTNSIFGFGWADIHITAVGDNAPLVEKRATGFVIGPFIFCQ